MNVQTTRFGTIQADPNRIITFPTGILGFPSRTDFVLLQPDDRGVFFWLQSTQAPDLAFVVTDPALWVEDYQVHIRAEQMAELSLETLDDAQVFVIVNRHGESLTANLQGPLVVNTCNQTATQLVLSDKRWTTRTSIAKVEEPAMAMSA